MLKLTKQMKTFLCFLHYSHPESEIKISSSTNSVIAPLTPQALAQTKFSYRVQEDGMPCCVPTFRYPCLLSALKLVVVHITKQTSSVHTNCTQNT